MISLVSDVGVYFTVLRRCWSRISVRWSLRRLGFIPQVEPPCWCAIHVWRQWVG